MKKIRIDDIEVEVKKKNIKNLNLRIKPPYGNVYLSVPWGISDEYIEGFLKRKKNWIVKNREKMKVKITKKFKYIDDEEHLVFGKNYKLKVLLTKEKQTTYINNNEIVMKLRKFNTVNYREDKLNEFYRELLNMEILKLVAKYEKIMGVSLKEFRTKRMKTRWGTCNIRERRIWINLEFAKLDLKFLEYIVVHEMVHLLEKNHNSRFYSFMDIYLDSWEELEKELNKNYL